MTREELSNIYYIQKEIKALEKRKRELQEDGEIKSPKLTGVPRGNGTADCVALRAIRKVALEEQISECLSRRYEEERNIREYINSVRDSQMRLILQYRHIDLLTWWQIAQRIGGGNTPAGVKSRYHRFIKERCNVCNDELC